MISDVISDGHVVNYKQHWLSLALGPSEAGKNIASHVKTTENGAPGITVAVDCVRSLRLRLYHHIRAYHLHTTLQSSMNDLASP